MITKRGAKEYFRLGVLVGASITGLTCGLLWSYARSSLMSEIKMMDNALMTQARVK